MAERETLQMPANAPQPVTWWLTSYYPTDASGQTATTVGVQFDTYDEAVTWARAKLATEGVGVCYLQQINGVVMFPLFEPEPN